MFRKKGSIIISQDEVDDMIFTLSEISLKEGIEEVTEDDIENIRRIKARLDEIGIRWEFTDLNINI